MFDEVPEPVWNTSIGNCSSYSPSATRPAALSESPVASGAAIALLDPVGCLSPGSTRLAPAHLPSPLRPGIRALDRPGVGGHRMLTLPPRLHLEPLRPFTPGHRGFRGAALCFR